MTSVATRAMRAAVEAVAAARPGPGRPPAFGFVPARRREPATLRPGRGPSGAIARAGARLAAGEARCTDLVEEALAAIGARNAELNAFVEVLTDGARAQARALDAELRAGRRRGPLHGIPISAKDVIHVTGVPTRAGSEAYETVPEEDATAVRLLRDAGCVILGKTTTHEFALGVTTPQSRNPHDAARIPGGSSGGSAVAVATGMGLASLGTDTRASIRIPPALSGVVGFKPTFGAVPADGLVQLSWTLDHVAPIARSVDDASLLLDVLCGVPLSISCGADTSSLRVGVPAAGSAGADGEILDAFQDALSRLRAVAAVREVARPSGRDFADANAAGLIVSRCEAAAYHRALGLDRAHYWRETRDQLDEADGVLAVDYLDAQRLRAQLAEEMGRVFRDVDALVMPTSLVAAPLVEEADDYLTVLSRNALLWSFIGFPAVSVPCGRTRAGLPVGLQIVAAPGEEHVLVALGSAFESLDLLVAAQIPPRR